MTDLGITAYHGGEARKMRALLWLIIASLLIFVVWAANAPLDEVAIGEAKVTPASKGQVIQSFEGGILAELFVREGDIVEAGEKLATLDPVQARTSMEEAMAKIVALQARAARLKAEMADATEVVFPKELEVNTDVVERERQLFIANRKAFKENLDNLKEQLRLADEELEITVPLLKSGATNEVEVLRLKQRVAEYSSKLAATESEYYVALKADFAETMGDLGPLLKVSEGRADQLRRTMITAPTHGIVKDIRITTIGGVVPSGGILMEIVPLGDQLLIEARLSPRDIAFIHPGQEANVKITAYDSAIYGSLSGKVDRVSPDTIEDQTDKRIQYYRVYVLTDQSYLTTKDGKQHPILPGMVATTEIRTGHNTVLNYLLKPLKKAGEAMRER
ncbi:MAG: HlyD family efflux transporter periplasmic adaptor subunit [Rhizobiaceae bacterium]|nr:HlyD family efflux transporter periplasmic adaptor subunit [Rhizobiaceae bacterium]